MSGRLVPITSAQYDALCAARDEARAERDTASREVHRLNAVLDDVTAERDCLAAALADRDAEVERLRALQQAIRECRDDPAGAILAADRVAGEHILRAVHAETRLADRDAQVTRVRALAAEQAREVAWVNDRTNTPCGTCGTRRAEHADQPEQSKYPSLDITDHPFKEQ